MKKPILSLLCLCLAVAPLSAAFTPVRLIEGLQPPYPEALKSEAPDGEAKVRAQVDATGAVTDASVVSASHEAFGAAALEAVRSWRFQPAQENGNPVPQVVDIPVLFKLSVKERINAQAGRKVFVDIGQLTDKVHGWSDVKKFFPPRGKDARVMAYPEQLKGSGISEEIQVRVILSPDGLPLNPIIVDLKNRELALPAILHVARMRFEKPKLNGQPIYLEQKIKLLCQQPTP